MPEPDRAVLGRRAEIVKALRRIVPGEGVIDHERELRAFESDGLTAYRQPPMVAVLPETTAQVGEVMRYGAAKKVQVGPRGVWAVTRRPAHRARSPVRSAGMSPRIRAGFIV